MNKFFTIMVVLTFALSSANLHLEELKTFLTQASTSPEIDFLSDPAVEFAYFPNAVCMMKAKDLVSFCQSYINEIGRGVGNKSDLLRKNYEVIKKKTSLNQCIREIVYTSANKAKCWDDAESNLEDAYDRIDVDGLIDFDRSLAFTSSFVQVLIAAMTECVGIH